MKRVFLALVAVITAATMSPAPAFAQRIVRETVRVHEERVRIHQGGPAMMIGQRYDGISYGQRGYIAINLNFGSGGRRYFQSYEPVRYVSRGDCLVEVDGSRPEDNLRAEVERMTDMCISDARSRGWPQPRVVVHLY